LLLLLVGCATELLTAPAVLSGVCALVQVNLLPVVEKDGSVVGIVTRHDILRGIYASKNPLL
jgi:CBS domain-containing protein